MRILRITVTVLFVLTTCMFVLFNIRYSKTDKTYPVITFDSETVNVPLQATDADFLVGVHAFDEKDGDISDKLIVESISRFTEPGVSIVKYSVCDGDKHSASAIRKVIYEGYSSPEFTLLSSLIFPIGQTVNIHSVLGATDKIDGDISDKVIVTSEEYSTASNGFYSITAKVTNSKGDLISLTLPVYVEERSLTAPEIKLGDYMIYCSKGDKIDCRANIKSAFTADGVSVTDSVSIDTNLDTNVPGMYEVHYRASDSLGRVGHVMAFVIVNE